jgi:hypothetical protein
MRTTVTLDDDLMRALKQRAHERERPFKQVLNEVVRAGLEAPPRPRKRFVQKTSDLGLRPGIDPTKLNELAAELEDERTIRLLRREG